jgi:uncharacterized protein YegJ (DUF2314 family)
LEQPSSDHEAIPFLEELLMKIVHGLLIMVVLSGAVLAADETTHMSGQENKVPGHPGYLNVADNDKAMDGAVTRAQKSLGFFIAAFKAKKAGDSSFEVKKGFVDGDKVEHLWIDRLTWDGKNFRGRINNRPLDVKNVQMNETVIVAPRDVSDWMFVKGGKLIGGFTTRVLYKRLSAEDKARFDKEAKFTIQ